LAERTEFLAILKRRRVIGYGLGVLAAAAVGTLGVSSILHLDTMAQESYSKLPFAYFGTIVAGQSLITIALVFFCYQLMRAAERLILPYWWAEKHPETARLVLGMTDPLSAASRLTEQIVDSASRLTGVSKPQA
jgi:hypothetical protein